MSSINSELVQSFPLEQALAARKAVLQRIEGIVQQLQDLKQMTELLGVDDLPDVFNHSSRYGCHLFDRDGLKDITKRLDARTWSRFMDLSGLKTFMDAKGIEEWNLKIYHHPSELPEFTEENVAATFGYLHEQRWEIFERGVITCFKSLSWDYKTNNPCKFGSKMIIGGMVSNFGGSWWRANSFVCDKINDLCRVMDVLDGKPARDHRIGFATRLQEALDQKAITAEDSYCSVKWFRNGNGHVKFTRPDLIDKLNAIVARYYPDALPSRA